MDLTELKSITVEGTLTLTEKQMRDIEDTMVDNLEYEVMSEFPYGASAAGWLHPDKFPGIKKKIEDIINRRT